MAKTKAPLTPEQAEVKAMKKANSSQNFIKFVAILLALALTAGVVLLGQSTAEKALAKGIKTVVFDRGGYIYHGRVEKLAEGAREGGLEF